MAAGDIVIVATNPPTVEVVHIGGPRGPAGADGVPARDPQFFGIIRIGTVALRDNPDDPGHLQYRNADGIWRDVGTGSVPPEQPPDGALTFGSDPLMFGSDHVVVNSEE